MASPPPPVCGDERQLCFDKGPGLWVEQNNAADDGKTTAEFRYIDTLGFTLWYNAAQLATVAFPTTDGFSWPLLLPPFNTACGCCDLCRAQPTNKVSTGSALVVPW